MQGSICRGNLVRIDPDKQLKMLTSTTADKDHHEVYKRRLTLLAKFNFVFGTHSYLHHQTKQANEVRAEIERDREKLTRRHINRRSSSRHGS